MNIVTDPTLKDTVSVRGVFIKAATSNNRQSNYNVAYHIHAYIQMHLQSNREQQNSIHQLEV